MDQNLLLAEVHHYETREIRDQHNRTVLEGGLEVDENFVFSYTPIGGVTQNISAAGPVSNYEHERTVNDEESYSYTERRICQCFGQ